MHIVTASDNNYVAGVIVLLSSAARHNPTARFTILTTDWSEQNLAKLAAFRTRTGLSIDQVEINADVMASLPITRAHLTRSAYARLFIPDLLPAADRVIYMDCDMLVTGSLSEAWAFDLKDNVLGAVQCPMPTPAFASAIDLPIAQYFNSGFLVMSLETWRREGIATICLRALAAPDCPYKSEDESALNDIARNRVAYLPAGFNLYAQDTVWQSPFKDPESIRVIHFVTRPKPWNGTCPFGKLWLAEIAGIPEYAGFKPGKTDWRARATRLNHLRRALMGIVVGKAKYRYYSRIGRFVRDVLVPQYLETGRFPAKGADFPSP